MLFFWIKVALIQDIVKLGIEIGGYLPFGHRSGHNIDILFFSSFKIIVHLQNILIAPGKSGLIKVLLFTEGHPFGLKM